MKIKQIYHHYLKWEDYKAGMWRTLPKDDEERYLKVAVAFTGDHRVYGKWMRKVVKAWPISSEHNLTDLNINRKAWTGHAAICHANGCPEYVTRAAWGMLTDDQRTKANSVAQDAIDAWEAEYLARQGERCPRLF